MSEPGVKPIRPEVEVMSTQKLPYFIGISGLTVGATGLSMHMVVIPPGARAQPHRHIGYETGIYVLEGRVLTRWGEALENEVVSQGGEFLFIPPGVPHEAINLSATEAAGGPSWRATTRPSRTRSSPGRAGRIKRVGARAFSVASWEEL